MLSAFIHSVLFHFNIERLCREIVIFFFNVKHFAGEAVGAWAHEVGEFSFIFYSDSGTHSDPTHINEIHASSE